VSTEAIQNLAAMEAWIASLRAQERGNFRFNCQTAMRVQLRILAARFAPELCNTSL
jgi:hypothetical protein